MTAKQDISIPIEPGTAYHIYNRGNNKQIIFFNEGNYSYFLDKYRAYMSGYWKTYAWALMNNHFHLVIQVRNVDEVMASAIRGFKKIDRGFYHKHKDLIEEAIKLDSVGDGEEGTDMLGTQNSGTGTDLPGFKNLVNLAKLHHPILLKELIIWAISERFRRFMLGYAKAINKQQNRTGSLFQKIYKRKILASDTDIRNAICYVHHNPIHHNLTVNYDQYQWSSYFNYINEKDADCYKYVEQLYEDLSLMISAHENYKARKKELNYNIPLDLDDI